LKLMARVLPVLDGDLEETEPETGITGISPFCQWPEFTHRLFRVRSAVPGWAAKLSAAPPTTIQMADPEPRFRIFEHDCLLTEEIPRCRRISR